MLDPAAASPESAPTPRAVSLLSAVLMRLLPFAVALGALAFVAIFVTLGVIHARYPFEIEWMEGGIVDQVRQVVAGKAIYRPPTIEFVPFIYAPLYFYVAAIFSKLFGIGFFPLRLVSLLASLGTAGLIARLVHKETRTRIAALASAGFFLGTYKLSSGFMDLARVDSLFVFFLVATVYVLRFGAKPRAHAFAAVLLLLAFLTKQSGVIVAGALVAWSILLDRPRSFRFAVPAVVFIGASIAVLEVTSGGWFLYYAYKIPNMHPSVPAQYYDFWLEDLLPHVPFAFLFGFAFVALSRERHRFLYAAAASGSLLASWTGRIHAGGFPNVNMPSFAFLAILLGLGLGLVCARVTAESPAVRAVALSAVAMQLALLIFDPRKYIPTERDEEAGREFVELLRKTDGDVFVLAHGHVATMAGKRPFAHEMAIHDILGVDKEGPGKKLRKDILTEFSRRSFEVIVLDTDFLKKEVERHYTKEREVFPTKEGFFPVFGMRTRPRGFYTPR